MGQVAYPSFCQSGYCFWNSELKLKLSLHQLTFLSHQLLKKSQISLTSFKTNLIPRLLQYYKSKNGHGVIPAKDGICVFLQKLCNVAPTSPNILTWALETGARQKFNHQPPPIYIGFWFLPLQVLPLSTSFLLIILIFILWNVLFIELHFAQTNHFIEMSPIALPLQQLHLSAKRLLEELWLQASSL